MYSHRCRLVEAEEGLGWPRCPMIDDDNYLTTYTTVGRQVHVMYELGEAVLEHR